MKTLILILLDESGSMSSQRADVIGGFDTFIEDQKKITDDEANVTFFKFNTNVIPVLKCTPVQKVPKLIFTPNGGTALYDAIWIGVQVAEETEHLFDRVICVIMTDGEDNSSYKITKAGVGDLMKKKEKEGKWTFMYIGQNPENWAKQTGMSVPNAIPFDHQHQRRNFQQAQIGLNNFRCQQMQQMPNVFMEPPRGPVMAAVAPVTSPMIPTAPIPIFRPAPADYPPPYSKN